jgi:hypothetical protein
MMMDGSTTHRRSLGTFERYEDAQALVDALSDAGFPVERVSIVGRDLQFVEKVTGRLDAVRAAIGGAVSGATTGGLLGLLFGVIFTHDGVSLLAIFLYWLVVGAIIGVAFALVAYAFMGGRRNFTSEAGFTATRYEVLVDESVADEAERIARIPRPAPTARAR